MCGRYQLLDDKDIEEVYKILKEINDKHSGHSVKTGEIYPTNTTPVLALENHKPSLFVMEWGFPKWNGAGVIINAKSETVSTKKMFAKSLIEKRCVIPSTGFFEWQKSEGTKNKTKYLFTMPDSPMLYMAAIYNLFKEGDAVKRRFVILTREANEYISDVHGRMPVILYKNELAGWLRDDKFIDTAFLRSDITLERELA